MAPLERACRAAHVEHNDDQTAAMQASDPSWDGWKSWVPVIRAVLTAIREPSDAMIEEGDSALGIATSPVIWRMMINAMLEEG